MIRECGLCLEIFKFLFFFFYRLNDFSGKRFTWFFFTKIHTDRNRGILEYLFLWQWFLPSLKKCRSRSDLAIITISVGVGVPLLIAAIVIIIVWKRYQRKARKLKEKSGQELVTYHWLITNSRIVNAWIEIQQFPIMQKNMKWYKNKKEFCKIGNNTFIVY